jgi:hypothetical protein
VSSIALEGRPHTISWRPLALPAEHGGWSFLLEPILLGLIIAPSWGGAAIGAGAVAAFLARHPLKLATQDYLRGKRYPRTRACLTLASLYGAAACAFLAFAPLNSLLLLAAAIPFAAVQFAFDVRNRGRALAPELLGGLAPGAIAMAITGNPVLWLLVALRALPSILYVRATLRGGSRPVMLAAHAAAAAVAAIVRPVAAIAMTLLALRAFPRTAAPAKTIGFREIAWGVVTVAIVGGAYISA